MWREGGREEGSEASRDVDHRPVQLHAPEQDGRKKGVPSLTSSLRHPDVVAAPVSSSSPHIRSGGSPRQELDYRGSVHGGGFGERLRMETGRYSGADFVWMPSGVWG